MKEKDRLEIFNSALDVAEKNTYPAPASASCEVCTLSGNCGLENAFRESRKLGLMYPCNFFGEVE